MSMHRLVLLLGLLLVLARPVPVLAHANLIQSDPPGNTPLPQAPAEIRLWFTEGLEPSFSKIIILDSTGAAIAASSEVDLTDDKQMVARPASLLPDGTYTITWRALSTVDGHLTQGILPIIIGAASGEMLEVVQTETVIPGESSLMRWLNFLSKALMVGGLGFLIFVWRPAASEPHIEQRMNRLIWLGWGLTGLTGLLMLLLQAAIAADLSIFEVVGTPLINQIVNDTRFGQVWMLRTAVWVGAGAALFFAASDRWFLWSAFGLSVGTLITTSLFSHASVSQDLTAAVGADILHLSATALWIGGLVQFLNVIGPVRRYFDEPLPVLSKLVGGFSNFARVAVASLIITGLYATWLQVGSVEALASTLYGQLLIIKLALLIPVLLLAAANLILTHRGLQAGDVVWGERLRWLVSAEVVLTVCILAVVGMMTAIQPARNEYQSRPVMVEAQPNPIVQTESALGMNVELEVSPGYTGENTFTVRVTDRAGEPIDDVSLIRLRVQSRSQNTGESELRPERGSEGVYSVVGSDLGFDGDWRIRTMVQRPGEFDTVVDFDLTLDSTPPPQLMMPVIDPNAPLPNRLLVLFVVGALTLIGGVFFLFESRLQILRGSGLLATGMLLIGIIFVYSGVTAL